MQTLSQMFYALALGLKLGVILSLALSGCPESGWADEADDLEFQARAAVAVTAATHELLYHAEHALPGEKPAVTLKLTPLDNRPVAHVYIPDFACPHCVRQKGDSTASGYPVRLIFVPAPEWFAAWVNADQSKRGYPGIHYVGTDGKGRLVYGYHSGEQLKHLIQPLRTTVAPAEGKDSPRQTAPAGASLPYLPAISGRVKSFTWQRGDLRAHMELDHHVQPAGHSFGELKEWHDRYHTIFGGSR